MSHKTLKDLGAAEKLNQDYGYRAKELKEDGQRVIGYLCAYVPLEIISAAGFIPFRIRGDVNEAITSADTHMETIVCPLVRSAYDMTLKGKYNFLEGMVMPHGCDSMCKTYDIWRDTLKLPYNHMLNVPHETGESSVQFFTEMLRNFSKSISRYGGIDITNETLVDMINTYNRMRSKVKDLYNLRKHHPPKMTGSETAKVLIAGMSLPVDEFEDLIEGVIEEVSERQEKQSKKGPRIMVVGAEIDNPDFIDLVEDCGGTVVVDSMCPGTREFFPHVSLKDDPFRALAERYLLKINCARTYREKRNDYEEYMEDRFGHLGKFIENYQVDGAILYFYKYCDPFGFEVPQTKSYIESKGVPVLNLEDEYTMSTMGRLKTRIEAFLESIA